MFLHVLQQILYSNIISDTASDGKTVLLDRYLQSKLGSCGCFVAEKICSLTMMPWPSSAFIVKS